MKRAIFLGLRGEDGEIYPSHHQPYEVGTRIEVTQRGDTMTFVYPWRLVGKDDIFRDSEIRIIGDVEVNLDDYL
jgi:hypothetical protein